MKKYILSAALLATICTTAFAQGNSYNKGTSVTYSKGFSQTKLTKDEIFDKTMIWFAKSFFHSYDAIISSNKETGTIVGRTFFYSAYKVPGKTDSTTASDFTNYNFQWTIQIINSHVNFSVSNIYINRSIDINSKRPVTSNVQVPFSVLLKSDAKMENDWSLSKAYLVSNLDVLVGTLNKTLTDNNPGW